MTFLQSFIHSNPVWDKYGFSIREETDMSIEIQASGTHGIAS